MLTIPLTLSETALAAGLTSFVGAITTVNTNLDSVEDATYFVPTNDAFEAVESAMNDASDSELQDILEYHYLNSSTTPLYTSLIDSAQQETAAGQNVRLSYNDDSELFVNSAAITHANILVANGVVHIIDQCALLSTEPYSSLMLTMNQSAQPKPELHATARRFDRNSCFPKCLSHQLTTVRERTGGSERFVRYELRIWAR